MDCIIVPHLRWALYFPPVSIGSLIPLKMVNMFMVHGCCKFIFIVIIQHSHACKNNCDVFYGREEELEAMHKYIVGPSQKVTKFYDVF